MLSICLTLLTVSRTSKVRMAVVSNIQGVTFEPATVQSLSEVSSFFVDAFWLASTTFPPVL